MKGTFLLLVVFGIFTFCKGQGMGGQTTGGEVVWNDDVSLDEIGSSPMLSVSSDSSSYPVHLGAIEGAGGGGAGSHGSGKSYSEGEFEIWSPRVSYSGDKFVLRGDSFSITCILTQFDQLKWTLDGNPVKFRDNGYKVEEISAPQGFVGSRLSVLSSLKEHAGEYKCTTFSPLSHSVYILGADESVGTNCGTEDSDTLMLLKSQQCTSLRIVKWQAGSSEATKLLRIAYPLSMECKIAHESDEKLELSWYKNDVLISSDDDHYKIFANSTLLIPKTVKEDVGVYRCQTVGFTPVKSFNISVVFLYKKDLPKSMTVLEGDKLTITCDTEGDPMPIITWLKDGVSVDEAVNNSRFTYEQNEKGTENATYIVESAAYSDRAEYACFISTGDLQFNTTIFVRVKDMYAALWPFLGICAEVFILCLIIFIYEKRRAKADFEESDTDQPTEQKNTSDHNKDSVRHRK